MVICSLSAFKKSSKKKEMGIEKGVVQVSLSQQTRDRKKKNGK